MDDSHDLLDVNHLITHGRESFLSFQIDGDSMVEEIPPSSFVFVDTAEQPQNGSIIAVLVNGRHSVKIFEQKRHGIRLVAANGQHLPQEVKESDTFHVLGVIQAHLVLHPRGQCVRKAVSR
jgi:SOS-response transcriptional repressor LexA